MKIEQSTKNEKSSFVRIKLKVGNIEAEVECREENLKKVVNDVLSVIQEQEIIQSISPLPELEAKPRQTCKELIRALWREGWFSVSRALNDTHNELLRRGFNYDKTAVAHSLANAVREGFLIRRGKPGKYLYMQREAPF